MKNQLKLLKKLGAPQKLIDSFVEVCEINSQLPEELKSNFPTLLQEQCRIFGFHSVLPEGWFFRPYASAGASHRHDKAVTADDPEAPAVEEAYRRGVAHGFSFCRQLIQDRRVQEIEEQEKKIDRWRKRSVQRFGSFPGNDERPPRKLFGGRYSISNKIRWLVFERDGFRCVKCGQVASSTASLEIDHVVPVAKGGFDTMENLQTLCNRCNSGKGDALESH